jgi:hypothetical protein
MIEPNQVRDILEPLGYSNDYDITPLIDEAEAQINRIVQEARIEEVERCQRIDASSPDDSDRIIAFNERLKELKGE